MNLFPPLLSIVLGSLRVRALSCLCSERTCDLAIVANCTGSTVPDVCGCCQVCAKQLGEECGGPWDVLGRCDDGLTCVSNYSESVSYGAVQSPDGSIEISDHAFFDQRIGLCQVYHEECWEVCDSVDDAKNKPIGFSSFGTSGIFQSQRTKRGYFAYCDCSNGKDQSWMVIQRRATGAENFDRYWIEYVSGFGSSDGDYWLGLEVISQLTQSLPHEFQVQIEYEDGTKEQRLFGLLRIGGEDSMYQLYVEHENESLNDDFIDMHNGMKFSAKDLDLDMWHDGNCAVWFRGGWWHNRCTDFNVNGHYYRNDSLGPDKITWSGSKLRVKMVEMRIRPLVPLGMSMGSGSVP